MRSGYVIICCVRDIDYYLAIYLRAYNKTSRLNRIISYVWRSSWNLMCFDLYVEQILSRHVVLLIFMCIFILLQLIKLELTYNLSYLSFFLNFVFVNCIRAALNGFGLCECTEPE